MTARQRRIAPTAYPARRGAMMAGEVRGDVAAARLSDDAARARLRPAYSSASRDQVARLPRLTRVDLLRVFGRAGWTVAREGAEHTILTHPKSPMTLAIPRHRGDLKEGTVRSLIRKAGLTDDEFLRLR
jgi:predicted RNA binding protein YcfA (HicA-like mRNA interferase family)